MADWQTISSLATAFGTLVLAVATFSALRSSNRMARIAEESLLSAMRPLLIPSLAGDPSYKALWRDHHTAHVGGGRVVVEEEDGVVYLAIGLRNVGSGIALLHGWHPIPAGAFGEEPHADAGEFRRLTIDLYVPAGGTGYWEAALRDRDDTVRHALLDAIAERRPFRIDLLYGDEQGGQRTISRFAVLPAGDRDGGSWYCQVSRHWSLDRPAPR